MRTDLPPTIYRKDYQEPLFRILTVEMGIDLDPQATVVATRLLLERVRPGDLVLEGEALELIAVHVDGRTLLPTEYAATPESLTLPGLPARCVLDVAVRLYPAANATLMGLFVSNGSFFTQCEAEGFRRITYFLDRPDVMARYTVMLRASKRDYPVLLSNGNLVASGDLPGGRHFAQWHDPFPKPSYLFALVAGRFAHVERRLKTASKRSVLLQIYVEPRDIEKVGHAMDALVHSLRWDEKRFGLELDLERFMIVAVEDFTMGAMENKGLNIFNTKFVLANPQLATDDDFGAVEAVVGHEYFHNWTGNRITCRDWFQLTLKEGLTVFRDQEFSADMAAGYLQSRDVGPRAQTARAVLRIDQVRSLRGAQFPEDAGPMAHPIRPDSYQEISNFYTPTVYEKGAEVVRMQQTLLGRDGFRAGLDEYFKRFDGQAVTCDDFTQAIESVYRVQRPGQDLVQFRLWYSQAGTPHVAVTSHYDAAHKTYTLVLRQSCRKVGMERHSPAEKRPFHIPFSVGLLAADGSDVPLRLAGDAKEASSDTTRPLVAATTRVLEFTQAEQAFTFVDVSAAPVPSLLRNFSAPVVVHYPYSEDELAHLSAHDSDAFNRWEATQRLATLELARLARLHGTPQAESVNVRLADVFATILGDRDLDPALKELSLTLPTESIVGEELPTYDPAAVHAAATTLRQALAAALRDTWIQTYRRNQSSGAYTPSPAAAGKRALKNLALSYLVALNEPEFDELAWRQYQSANNMTDRFAALSTLVNNPTAQRTQALAEFYHRYARESLVVDKWLRVQATSRRVNRAGLKTVQQLMDHPAFSLRNPNKVFALLLSFFASNPAEFHRPDGAGYTFWGKQVLALDEINPQVASRIARTLDRWRKLTPALQAHAEEALRQVHAAPRLSKDLAEIVGKALKA